MDYFRFLAHINRMLFRRIGGDSRPTFFDIDETYPSLNAVTSRYALIRTEFEDVIARTSDLPTYHDIDPAEAPISNTTPKKWNVFLLHLLGRQVAAGEKLCPGTCRIVSGIPGVVQAFFSILEPGKKVPLHNGPYFGYLRYHLGLQVPNVNPPFLRINNQRYRWREGEAVLFDDSWPHEVVNTSNESRAVLIIDVMRPMPVVGSVLNKLAVFVARRTYARDVIGRLDAYNNKQVMLFFKAFS